MKIAIIGSGVEVFCCGHRLLDLDPELELHIFDEKAESGMYGEEPGIIKNWPITPIAWYGKMYSQMPTQKSSAVRYSWFVKSLSIMLAKRDATFHLKSRVTKIGENNVHFSGAGFSGTGNMKFAKIIDLRNKKEEKKWFGAISNEIIEGEIHGTRSDNTVEIWSDKGELEGDFIQIMNWYGKNPKSAISERVQLGIETAELTII